MSGISKKLNQSMAQHQAGNLAAAERGYREILRFDPSHAEAMHLLGVAATQRGEPRVAIGWFEQARANAEPSALLLNNLGTALRDAGRLNDAVDAFQQAARIAPEFAGARFNLAMALEADGRVTEAVAEYEAAIVNDPGMAAAHLRLGCLLLSRNDLERGIASLATADAISPRTVEILWPLAQAQASSGRLADTSKTLRKLLRLAPTHADARALFVEMEPHVGRSSSGNFRDVNGPGIGDMKRMLEHASALEIAARYDESVATLRRVLEIDPRNVDAHTALGRHAVEIGRPDEARHHFQRVVESQPDHLESRLQLSNLLADAGEVDGAIEQARAATHHSPQAAIAWFGLANLLKDAERFNESAACFRTAIECDADCSGAVHNLGIVCRYLGRLDESLACFDRLIKVGESNAQAHLQRSLTRLTMGNLSNGWDEYEWRWRAEAERRRFPVPEWDGSLLDGRTVLVHAEQGIGDQVQFASCLPEVAARSGRCIVECERRLVPLFSRSFPDCDVVPQPYSGSVDYHSEIPLGSLPRLFRRRFTAFPTEAGYLRPDVAHIARWRERFEQLGAGITVGVSWRGGSRPGDVRSRSTQLAEWRSILGTPNVRFVNLQYGDVTEALQTCARDSGVTIHDWDDADPLVDLDDFAAQIAALDLVISVDNSTVHLAGALGAPVWTLLPFAADPRWMRETARSPWYPSMRLYRAAAAGEWNVVFEAVASELALKVRGRLGNGLEAVSKRSS